MTEGELTTRMRWYQATALFSVLFALLGFSYNVWRLELSEQNNVVRAAAFESLLQLAELEQLVYAAHYDSDPIEGNPRRGWVKVGLLVDLGHACDPEVLASAESLREVWGDNWQAMPDERAAADEIVQAIDVSRARVQAVLAMLE